jgi:hypothetical protein
VQECRYERVFAGFCVSKPGLLAQQLSSGMQLTYKHLSSWAKRPRGLGENRFEVFDVFQNQHRYHDIRCSVPDRPRDANIMLNETDAPVSHARSCLSQHLRGKIQRYDVGRTRLWSG